MLIRGRPYRGSPGRLNGSMLVAACVRREELGTPSPLRTSRVRRKAWDPNDVMLREKLLFCGPSTQLVGCPERVAYPAFHISRETTSLGARQQQSRRRR